MMIISKQLNKNIRSINKGLIAITLSTTLLLSFTMFLSTQIFIDSEIISKWYAYIAGSIFCGLLTFLIIRKPVLSIDWIVLVVSIFITYLIARAILDSVSISNPCYLSIAAFTLLYFSFKLFTVDCFHLINTIIIILCIIQGCIGLIQYFGIINSNNTFRVVGSFDNPAGFAGCLSAGFSFCLPRKDKGKWMFLLGTTAMIIISSSIILSESRAGITSIALITTIHLISKYYSVVKMHKKHLPTALIFIIFASFILLILKKESAIGRIFIWMNSCRMITDCLFTGRGWQSFSCYYMQYQGEYFAQNPKSEYAMIADNVNHPFNEYLLLTFEHGIIGLILFLIIISTIILSTKQISSYHLCLISIGIFACFSYPLRYSFVLVLIAYSLSQICSKKLFSIQRTNLGKTVVMSVIIFISTNLVKNMQFEQQWYQLIKKMQHGNNESLLDEYRILHSKWKHNPLFLYNFGAELNQSGKYCESIKVLQECSIFHDDYDVQILLGDNYANLNELSMAVFCYEKAQCMIPCRFLPLYKLMLLYEVSNNRQKEIELAKIIVNKVVKVPSKRITYIQNKAKLVIKKNN